MIKTTTRTLRETISALFSNRAALAIFAGLYALLLATLYGFIATREATVWQVLLTLCFLVLAPAEFFITQAAVIAQARFGRIQWGHVLSDSCKLLVVTLPVLGIGWLLFYLLNKWQAHFPVSTAPVQLVPQASESSRQVALPPISLSALIFATVRTLLFWIVLPLTMIQLWIGVTSDDLRHLVGGGASSLLKRIGHVLARTFAPQSAMIYAIGFVLFALVPYTVLFIHVPAKGLRTDFAVFIFRIVLAYLFSLMGWLLTVNALTRIGGPSVEQPVSKAEPEPIPAGAV